MAELAITALMMLLAAGTIVALVVAAGRRQEMELGSPRPTGGRWAGGLPVDAGERLIELEKRWRLRPYRAAARVRDSHRCLECGYDVRLLDSPACPECGASIRFMKLPAPSVADRVEALQGRPMDEATARRLLPESQLGGDLFEILLECGYQPIWATCRVFEILLRLDGRPLDDRAALELLPDSEACRGLYNKHRELGRDPLWTLRCILPYSRVFDRTLQYLSVR